MEEVEFTSKNKNLQVRMGYNWESRGLSVERLVKEAYEKSEKPDFNFIICTGDNPVKLDDKKVYCFSTTTKNYTETVPDFWFDGWPETGVDNYEKLVEEIKQSGKNQPETNKCGWIGAESNHLRRLMVDMYEQTDSLKELCEFQMISWNYQDPTNLTKNTTSYISIPDQVNKYRFLIDVQGNGYSGRFKSFLFSNRVVFYVERQHEEFWQKELKPWIHYVPIKQDFSDLECNIRLILEDKNLEEKIINYSLEFANNNLLKKHAIDYYVKLINSFS